MKGFGITALVSGTLVSGMLFGGGLQPHIHTDGSEADEVAAYSDPVDITESDWQPTVTISATPDGIAGWNVTLQTTNFAFAPGAVGEEPVEGEGHAHLYLDGRKIARLYGRAYHIANPTPGTHTLRVTLQANTHHPLYRNGNPIMAETTIDAT